MFVEEACEESEKDCEETESDIQYEEEEEEDHYECPKSYKTNDVCIVNDLLEKDIDVLAMRFYCVSLLLYHTMARAGEKVLDIFEPSGRSCCSLYIENNVLKENSTVDINHPMYSPNFYEDGDGDNDSYLYYGVVVIDSHATPCVFVNCNSSFQYEGSTFDDDMSKDLVESYEDYYAPKHEEAASSEVMDILARSRMFPLINENNKNIRLPIPLRTIDDCIMASRMIRDNLTITVNDEDDPFNWELQIDCNGAYREAYEKLVDLYKKLLIFAQLEPEIPENKAFLIEEIKSLIPSLQNIP